MSEISDLHIKERPNKLGMVMGQKDAVSQIEQMMVNGAPHALLFSGPSGCGKTTLARIVARMLKCARSDFAEVNAADSRGIEMVRGIQARAGLAPLGGGACRVWLIDECHQLTAEAQSALLKLLEEPPSHVYFMLATTHPDKLRDAIRTRCTHIKVKPMDEDSLTALVTRACAANSIKLTDDVKTKLVDAAGGSARRALVLLQTINGLDAKTQIEVLGTADAKQAAIEIARALMARKGWKDVAAIIAACSEDPEGIRWMILSYFSKVALGGGRECERAAAIMRCFQYNYFDTKQAGLILSCMEACGL